MSSPLAIDRTAGVLRLAVSTPERRNALSRGVLEAMRTAVEESQAAAIVLTGAGDAFSAGADLRELAGTRADRAVDDEIERTAAALQALPVPVVAAIEGPCMGAAVELALACDVRIAGAGAFFEVPAVRLGLLYSPAALVRMRRVAPAETLARLFLLGERLDAQQAREGGLVGRVVPAGDACACAMALAEAVPAKSARAMRATKSLLTAAEPDPRDWEAIRLALLDSPERVRALEAVRGGKGRLAPR